MIQKDKVRVDIFGERFRTRASQLTRVKSCRQLHCEHREVVLEANGDGNCGHVEHFRCHSYQGYRPWVLPGCVIWKRTLEQWLSPALSSSERCLRR